MLKIWFFCLFCVCWIGSVFALKPTSAMYIETIFFIQLLENFHLLQKRLSDFSSKEILESYVETVDPSKMIFTQNQVDQFVNDYQRIAEILWRGGSLTPGFALMDIYQRQFSDRVQWIQTRLERPFFYDTHETFFLDRKEAAWETNLFNLDHLWEQRLQHEMINEMLYASNDVVDMLDSTDKVDRNEEKCITKEEAFKNEEKARETLKARYKDLNRLSQMLESVDVQELYCNNLAQFYDPHTTFFSADSMEDFSISLRNSLVGIGAYLKEDKGTCIIQEVLPGGPAERCQQLNAGDKILSVAQEKGEFVNIRGMKLRHSVKLIRGEKGTLVRLLIQPADGDPSQRKIVELIRDEIKLEDKLAFAKVFYVPDEHQAYHCIGWIDLPAFYGPEDAYDKQTHALSNDVKELISDLKAYPIEGIILDMRRNGGGLLTEAVKLAGLFLNNCPVVQVKGGRERNLMYADSDVCVWNGPLLILTSRFSASASEIVAGALQGMCRALVFGDKTTHGKGTVQALIEMSKLPVLATGLSNLGAAKLTIQKWYLPSGFSTQLSGVQADMSLPSVYDCLPIGEADLPHALPGDKVSQMPCEANMYPTNQWLQSGTLQFLMQRQHVREQTDLFKWYYKRVDWFAKKYKRSTYTLNLQARIQSVNADRLFRKKLDMAEAEFLGLQHIGRPIFLKDVKLPKQKNGKRNFDFFQHEALAIMSDWLQYVGIKSCDIPVWRYGQVASIRF